MSERLPCTVCARRRKILWVQTERVRETRQGPYRLRWAVCAPCVGELAVIGAVRLDSVAAKSYGSAGIATRRTLGDRVRIDRGDRTGSGLTEEEVAWMIARARCGVCKRRRNVVRVPSQGIRWTALCHQCLGELAAVGAVRLVQGIVD